MAGQIKVDSINADSNLALKIANTAVAFIDATGLRPVAGNLNLDATATSKLYLPSANTVAIQTAGVTGLSISSSQVVTLANALPVTSGGTGVTTSTGTGAVVLGTSPTITTPTISSLSSASATALTLKSAGTTAITVDTSQNTTFAGAVQITTLNSSTGVLATQNGMTGIAKAWAVWNPVASTLQSGSFNISSYTRNSAGNYTFSFTTSMPNTTYAVSGTFPGAGVTIWVNSPLTGSVQIYAKNYNNGFDDGISGLASIIVFSS